LTTTIGNGMEDLAEEGSNTICTVYIYTLYNVHICTVQTYSCAHCCVFYSEIAYFQLASPYRDRITRFFISSFFFHQKEPT
jgi:hypothetical protein